MLKVGRVCVFCRFLVVIVFVFVIIYIIYVMLCLVGIFELLLFVILMNRIVYLWINFVMYLLVFNNFVVISFFRVS